jgi:hypothetical protein
MSGIYTSGRSACLNQIRSECTMYAVMASLNLPSVERRGTGEVSVCGGLGLDCIGSGWPTRVVRIPCHKR